MTWSPVRAARPLLVAAAIVALAGVAAAATVEPEDPAAEAAPERDDRGTTGTSRTTATIGATTTTAAAVTSTTTEAPATSAPRSATTAPRSTTVPTAPPTTAPPVSVPTPPTTVPSGTIRLLITNESPHLVEISVNMGFLGLQPGESYDGLALAELGADGDVPPGTDLVTVAIAHGYGHPDEGCGSHSLAHLFEPGGSYRMRIGTGGTCQLLGGSAKPTFSITRR